MNTYIVNMKDGKVYEVEAFRYQENTNSKMVCFYNAGDNTVMLVPVEDVDSVIRKDMQNQVRLLAAAQPKITVNPVPAMAEKMSRMTVALLAIRDELDIKAGDDWECTSKGKPISHEACVLVMKALV